MKPDTASPQREKPPFPVTYLNGFAQPLVSLQLKGYQIMSIFQEQPQLPLEITEFRTVIEAIEAAQVAGIGFNLTFIPPSMPTTITESVTDVVEATIEPTDSWEAPKGKDILYRSAARLFLRTQTWSDELASTDSISTESILDFLTTSETFLDSCEFAGKFTNPCMNRTPVAVAHFMISLMNGENAAEKFLKPIATLANLIPNSPEHVIARGYVLNQNRSSKAESIDNEVTLYFLINGFNQSVENKQVSKLRTPTNLRIPQVLRIN